MTETTFYLLYPIRKSKFGYKKMRLFYLSLGILWIVAAIYLYFNNPTGTKIISVIYSLIGLALEIMAFFYPIVILGRYVTVNENSLDIYLSPLRKAVVSWDQLQSVKINDKTLHLKLDTGEDRKFNLSKLDNRQWKLLNKKLGEVLKEKMIPLK